MIDITREEARTWLQREMEKYERGRDSAGEIGWNTAPYVTGAARCRFALAALEDAERYRYLCEWREWPDEVEAAFDCGDKLVIDAAIDRARGV